MRNVNSDGWAGLGKLCTVEKIFINLIFLNITAILSCHVCVGVERAHVVNADLWPSPGQLSASLPIGLLQGRQRPARRASARAPGLWSLEGPHA